MGVLTWILVVLGGLVALLLALLVAVLLVPLRLDATWTEARRRFAVSGPGLSFGYDAHERTMEIRVLALFRRRWSTQREKPKPARPRKDKERRRPRRRLAPRRLWAQRRRVLASLRTFLRRLRVRRLRVEAIVATPDPALTGWLCGAAHAGRAALPARWRAGLSVRPDFEREAPDLEADASLLLQPLQAALLALRLWLVVRRARSPRPRRARESDTATSRPPGGGRDGGS